MFVLKTRSLQIRQPLGRFVWLGKPGFVKSQLHVAFFRKKAFVLRIEFTEIVFLLPLNLPDLAACLLLSGLCTACTQKPQQKTDELSHY